MAFTRFAIGACCCGSQPPPPVTCGACSSDTGPLTFAWTTQDPITGVIGGGSITLANTGGFTWAGTITDPDFTMEISVGCIFGSLGLGISLSGAPVCTYNSNPGSGLPQFDSFSCDPINIFIGATNIENNCEDISPNSGGGVNFTSITITGS